MRMTPSARAGLLSLCALACGCSSRSLIRIPAELTDPLARPTTCERIRTNGDLEACRADLARQIERYEIDRAALRELEEDIPK